MAQEHVCGLTGQRFASEQEYLDHTSEVTGYKPTDIEHHGVQGIKVAEKALERTGSLKAKVKTDLNTKLSEVRAKDVDGKVREKQAAKSITFSRLTR